MMSVVYSFLGLLSAGLFNSQGDSNKKGQRIMFIVAWQFFNTFRISYLTDKLDSSTTLLDISFHPY